VDRLVLTTDVKFLLKQSIDRAIKGEHRPRWWCNSVATIQYEASRTFDEVVQFCA
jgi:hypothetical protein